MALQRSRSSPQAFGGLAKQGAAYNLRQFSLSKKLVGLEQSMSEPLFPLETLKERERRRFLEEQQMAWHQKEEDERGLQEKARRYELKVLEKERAIKKEERRNEREARFLASVNAWKKEQEDIKRRKFEEEERIRLEKEERLRDKREKAEAERLRRMPWTCEDCRGTGSCSECRGSGCWNSLFLSQTVSRDAPLVGCGAKFGTSPQGCPKCHGFGPGIRGEFTQGTGICNTCHGHKMIWPAIAYHQKGATTCPRV